MNFNIYPNRGFLNTYFGFKLIDFASGHKFRFSFPDGSSTKWLTEDQLIYKQFFKAGEHNICLEYDEGKVEKKIFIKNSFKLGNGESLGIFFPQNNNIIIQRKSTGINVFYKNLNSKISGEVLPDEIWNWDDQHALFFTSFIKLDKFPKGLFGLFNYELGDFSEEFEGNFIFFSPNSQKLIYHQENKIFVRYAQKEQLEIEGRFQSIDNSNSILIYKIANVLKQFDVSKNESRDIGQYDFIELTAAKNLIVLKKDDYHFIWDIFKKKMVAWRLKEKYKVYSDGLIVKFNHAENSLSLRILNSNTKLEKSRFETFQYELSEDRKFLIRISNLNYHQVFTLQELDQKTKFLEYKFKKVLISDLITVEIEGKQRLYSLSNSKLLYPSEENILCAFYKDERPIIVIQSGGEVSFFEYKNYLKLIKKYKGSFDPEFISKLLDHSTLWIKLSDTHFKLFNGLTNEEIKDIQKKQSFGQWMLTESSIFINDITLEEINSNFSEYYSVNDSLTEGLISKTDGLYLVKIRDKDLTEQKVFDADIVYTDCDVHPMGKIAVLSHQGMTEFLDLETFNKIEIPDTSFLHFDHDGEVILNEGTHYNIKPRIFDSITFKEIPQYNFTYYKYFSPDGNWKSNHNIETTRIEIDHPLVDGKLTPITTIEEEKRLRLYHHPENTESKLLMKGSPDIVNYLSFSPQNDFIAYAGKINMSDGIVELFNTSISSNKIFVKDSKIFRASKAVWRCVFSSDNKYLGYYSSEPVTFILQIEQAFEDIEPKEINNRSIECFSPDSLFIILSQHKYEAITLGGEGWIPSSKIYISDVSNFKELVQFDEHNTQVVFANFSSNGKKLISRSEDGIVIIRNFDYDKLIESKRNNEQ